MKVLAGVGMLLLAACGSSPTSASPTPGSPISVVELKYRLLAQVGPIDYCDPDAYPVARPVTPAYVTQRLADISAGDAQTYQAILEHDRLGATLTQQQQLLVYIDYKELMALQLQPDGDRYDFGYAVSQGPGKESMLTKGTIDRTGSIAVQSRAPFHKNCPICLAAWTEIDTPDGPILVTALRPGMSVWTLSAAGVRQVGIVLKVGHMPAPAGHEMIHLVLADGRQVWVSPGHPTVDGRRVGELVPGAELDGGVVLTVDRVAYSGATYDLLPAGQTGAYWADGILLGSTLAGLPRDGNLLLDDPVQGLHGTHR